MTHGETGLIVPPGNAQMLTDAILQLLSDPSHARTKGEAARKRVAIHYGAQRQACEHLVLYRRLLTQPTASD